MTVVKGSGESHLPMGLDLGSRCAKAIELVERGTVEIRAAGSIDVPAGLIEAGKVRDPRRLGRLIADGLDALGVHATSAVISVPSSLAILRWVTLPDLPTIELREAARFKVKRHLPFPVDSAYIEASHPDVEADGTGQSLVIAVRKEVIDSRAEAVEYAGIAPIAAELEAQAILRVVERKLNDQGALYRDATLTIIDIGAAYTHMYVVQNQRLQFIRGVRFGSDRISESIARELEVSLHEAEEYLAHPESMVTEDGTLYLRTGDLIARLEVHAEFEKLTREFGRLLRYFRSLHPERSYAGILDHVLMCGGMAGLKGFDRYLAKVLSLRVELARPFSGMLAKLQGDSFENLVGRQEAFSVGVGLALSSLRSDSRAGGEHHAGREFVWARSA